MRHKISLRHKPAPISQMQWRSREIRIHFGSVMRFLETVVDFNSGYICCAHFPKDKGACFYKCQCRGVLDAPKRALNGDSASQNFVTTFTFL